MEAACVVVDFEITKHVEQLKKARIWQLFTDYSDGRSIVTDHKNVGLDIRRADLKKEKFSDYNSDKHFEVNFAYTVGNFLIIGGNWRKLKGKILTSTFCSQVVSDFYRFFALSRSSQAGCLPFMKDFCHF